MDFAMQGRRSVTQHAEGTKAGKTCIDCHKGIAHSLPDLSGIDPSATLGGN
jgi:cytochrome c-type protein NapC